MIRAAYRTLAKAYHPDRIGPDGASQFREISEAYRVLSDPVLRAAHNAALQAERTPAEPTGRWGSRGVGPLVAEPIAVRRHVRASPLSVEEEFTDCTMRNFTARHLPESRYQREADIEVILTPQEAALGGILPIELPAFSLCPVCGGSGRDWFSVCPSCSGTGVREGRRIARIEIPELVRDGTTWEIPVSGGGRRLRIRIRVDPFSW
jgi:DnaJ-class molecular chaperone